VLALPFLFYYSRKEKYKDAIPSRFFLKNNPPLKPNSIWFHGASLGEIASLKPIIEHFKNDFNIEITTITNTGFNQAKKLVKNPRFLPFEIFAPFWVKRQKLFVILEAELWYFMILFAKLKGAKTILLNARISDRSYHKYLKVKWFYRFIFSYIDIVYTQTQKDAKRLEEIGAKNIEVLGNIKLIKMPQTTNNYQKPNILTVVGASTHEGEENLILDSFINLKGKAKLIIVPRHPERFEDVYITMSQYVSKHNLSISRFSEDKSFNSDLILIDTMGELINIYAISDIVVLGGSFAEVGGHNPIEPAFFNTKIISGKKIFNQEELYSCVDNIKMIENNQLTQTLKSYSKLNKTNINQSVDITSFYKIIENTKN